MAKFKSKPRIIEAEQWFRGKDIKGVVSNWDNNPMTPNKISVLTIHGQYADLTEGDYVITEPDGVHHYPCKPDIFEKNYDLVEEK